ncbi:hypothetical protein MAJHIDBO_01320 [Propionibacterium freudenreichii subsp. shermanii]|nr:hypothetical protein MAJHIDBO_01320 [Propionibacterium freudenreichii subsp. shermanii]SPS09115.1 hypothetical protein MAJHIDBO_01320 [Propionibacterium freudenreichii subsp. shermanii]
MPASVVIAISRESHPTMPRIASSKCSRRSPVSGPVRRQARVSVPSSRALSSSIFSKCGTAHAASTA